jgi:hypothetical protein
MAGCRRFWQAIDILVAWAVVSTYIYVGGIAHKSFEINAEMARTRAYCVKIDMLMQSLAVSQRKSFSTLLDMMVDSGMCRAPLCKLTPLPLLPVDYAFIASVGCPEFMANHTTSFEATVLSSLDLTMPAKVVVDGCHHNHNSHDDERRLNENESDITLEVIISSDTMEAMDTINNICHDSANYIKSFAAALEAANHTRLTRLSYLEAHALHEPKGSPMMLLDVSNLDSYPASMFNDPNKSPGEPLDGFAAYDLSTGAVAPLVAPPAVSIGATKSIVVQSLDDDEASSCGRQQRRRLFFAMGPGSTGDGSGDGATSSSSGSVSSGHRVGMMTAKDSLLSSFMFGFMSCIDGAGGSTTSLFSFGGGGADDADENDDASSNATASNSTTFAAAAGPAGPAGPAGFAAFGRRLGKISGQSVRRRLSEDEGG